MWRYSGFEESNVFVRLVKNSFITQYFPSSQFHKEEVG